MYTVCKDKWVVETLVNVVCKSCTDLRMLAASSDVQSRPIAEGDGKEHPMLNHLRRVGSLFPKQNKPGSTQWIKFDSDTRPRLILSS